LAPAWHVPGTANCPERSAAAREGFERRQRAAGVEPVDERAEPLLARPTEEGDRRRAERERALAVREARSRVAAAHLPDRAAADDETVGRSVARPHGRHVDQVQPSIHAAPPGDAQSTVVVDPRRRADACDAARAGIARVALEADEPRALHVALPKPPRPQAAPERDRPGSGR